MKYLGAALVLSGTLVSSLAFAADMAIGDSYVPPEAESVMATPFAGFYAGGFFGYAGTKFEGIVDNDELPDTEFAEPFSGDYSTGVSYGLFLGYNIVNNGWLLGVEGDFGSAQNSETAVELDDPDRDWATHSINWTSSLRGRLGTIIGGATALYVTGGVAIISSNFHAFDNQNDVDPEDGAINLLSTSYIVGAGVEHMVTDNVSIRLEGLFTGPAAAHVFDENQLTDDMDDGDFAKIGGRFEIRAGAALHF